MTSLQLLKNSFQLKADRLKGGDQKLCPQKIAEPLGSIIILIEFAKKDKYPLKRGRLKSRRQSPEARAESKVDG